MRLFEPVSAPPDKRRANGHAVRPALIEDAIPLPSLLLLRSRSYLDGSSTPSNTFQYGRSPG